MSLSTRSASLYSNRPLSEASIVLHALPSLKAAAAAWTALSTSAWIQKLLSTKILIIEGSVLPTNSRS